MCATMTSTRLTELRALAATGAQGQKSEAIRELCDEVAKLQRRRDAAKGPTLSEVMEYAKEIGLNSGEPENFFDYHTARGWKMGKLPMRDFKAAMRLWKRKCKLPADTKQPIEPAQWKDFIGEKYPLYMGDYAHAPEYLKLEFGRWKKSVKA